MTPKLTPEQEKKLDTLDSLKAERASAETLLAKVNELFPLSEQMPPEFKGSHSLTLKPDGTLQINIWIAGHIWPVWF